MARLDARLNPPPPPPPPEPQPDLLTDEHRALLEQSHQLQRIDVRDQNRGGTAPTFDALVSQAASAEQCEHPRYREWFVELEQERPPIDLWPSFTPYHRKMWEWIFIAEVARQYGVLSPGHRALGFGCGTEPTPALLAKHGMDVIATDLGWDEGDQEWNHTNQRMAGLESLSRPYLLADAALAERVTVRAADMTRLPPDLGTHDLVWSACVIEHLGSPQLGLDFVLESTRLLAPGGVAVHTTELELVPRDQTMDWGHCAVYRLADLHALRERVVAAGCEMTLNPYVSMDSPQDRWVSLALTSHVRSIPDAAHLRLVIGESVSTSFGLVILRPR